MLAGVVFGCASSPEHHPAYKGVFEANRELERRFTADDGLGVAAMYTDDGLLLSPGLGRTEGREALDASWDRPRVDPEWALTIDRLEGDEDRPIQRGRSVLSHSRDGERVVSEVEFVVIWERQDDGSYRIVVDAYWRD